MKEAVFEHFALMMEIADIIYETVQIPKEVCLKTTYKCTFIKAGKEVKRQRRKVAALG